MQSFTILRDNRERKPWEFEDYDVRLQDVTLKTGDYTLEEFCEHDPENDTYHPCYAIERKSGSDFLASITGDRSRFQDEIKRAGDWNSPLLVIIEEPKNPKRHHGKHFIKKQDISRSQVFGTVDSWENHYNVSFRFAGNRRHAQQVAYQTLSTQLRALQPLD